MLQPRQLPGQAVQGLLSREHPGLHLYQDSRKKQRRCLQGPGSPFVSLGHNYSRATWRGSVYHLKCDSPTVMKEGKWRSRNDVPGAGLQTTLREAQGIALWDSVSFFMPGPCVSVYQASCWVCWESLNWDISSSWNYLCKSCFKTTGRGFSPVLMMSMSHVSTPGHGFDGCLGLQLPDNTDPGKQHGRLKSLRIYHKCRRHGSNSQGPWAPKEQPGELKLSIFQK